MTILLKQSTAATVPFGPFLDDTDGKTAETGLSVTQATVRLSKNGGAFAQKTDSATSTHMENGYYSLALDATDTGTLGWLRVHSHISGALPVWNDFQIIPANIYDSLVLGTDYIDANVISMANDAVSAAALKTDAVTEITGGILNATASSYDTAGTIGEAINNAGGGSVTVNSYVAVSAAVAATVASGRVAVQPYATLRQSITCTTTEDLANADKLRFAIKYLNTDDATAVVLIEKTDGLLYLARASYGTAAHGSITVSGSSGAWTVAIFLHVIATSLLAGYDGQTISAELKLGEGTDATIIWTGYADFANGLITATT